MKSSTSLFSALFSQVLSLEHVRRTTYSYSTLYTSTCTSMYGRRSYVVRLPGTSKTNVWNAFRAVRFFSLYEDSSYAKCCDARRKTQDAILFTCTDVPTPVLGFRLLFLFTLYFCSCYYFLQRSFDQSINYRKQAL